MNRRAVLASIGTFAVGGLAGCIEDGGDSGDTGGDDEELPGWSETDTEEGEREETPTEIREAETTLTDASLTIVDVGCGQDHDEADVEFDYGGEVVVEGTIWGANPCKIPELLGADYDAGADELTVTVGTTNRSDETGGCVQCIAELDYRVTAVFEGGLPGTVTVVHDRGDGEDVVVTTRSSS